MKAGTMMGSLGLILFLSAFAAMPATAEERGPVLVWGVSAVTDLPEDQAKAVSSWLPGEVARTTGMEVIEDTDVDEGVDLAWDNGECRENNMACVVEVARALDVPEAVSGDLGVVNGVYILTLRRIDVIDGNVIKQVSAQTNVGVDVLIQSMSDMVATLYDIPHNQVGTVRSEGRNDGYDYVVVTYGPSFSWIEPVVWYGYYPWWWAGPVHYYHHHYVWWAWHYRHPHGRPHYAGPRRPYPHRHNHHDGNRHDGDRHTDGDRSTGGEAAGRDDRPQGDRKDDVTVRPMPRVKDNPVVTRPPRNNDAPVNNRGDGGAIRPSDTPRPDKGIRPPANTVLKPQRQKADKVRPGAVGGQAPAVRKPATGHSQPAVRGNGGGQNKPAVRGNGGGQNKPAVRGTGSKPADSKKKNSSGSSGSSGKAKSPGKAKSGGIRGPGGSGTGAKPATPQRGH